MLCLSEDRYFNQDILIHEFSHGVHLVSAEDIDSEQGQPLFFHILCKIDMVYPIIEFKTRLEDAYEQALGSGLWENTYAATNYIEYFGIGVQCYFDNSVRFPK